MALCIGGTSADVAALDGEDRIIEESRLPIRAGGALMEACKVAADRVAFTLEHWDEFVVHRRRLLDELGLAVSAMVHRLERRGEGISGIGVSAPGAIHPQSGEIPGATGALNLPAWGCFNLRKEIQDRTGLKVRAINDAKAMALGAFSRLCQDVVCICPSPGEDERLEERFLGEAGCAIRDFIELDPGTGLGGAYIVDGGLWFGPVKEDPDPDVGEIWKIEAAPDMPGVNLEELTSGRTILARVVTAVLAEAPDEGRALIDQAGGRIQRMIEHASSSLKTIIGKELERAGRYLGRGIHYLMTRERERLGAPYIRTFMIGGGLVGGRTPAARQIRVLFHQAITRDLGETVPPIRILFSTLGGLAGVYGSAALVRD
jgi:predicted NBD/HSP70 family sugar kinase